MRILLIGHGAIGAKHHANIKLLRPDAAVDVADPIYPDATYPSLKHAGYNEGRYDLAIVATPTSDHIDHLHCLNDWGYPYLLLEKPLFGPNGNLKKLYDQAGIPQQFKQLESRVFVNNCYRFERGILKLKELMERGVAGDIKHVSFENSYSFKKLHPHYEWSKYDGILYDDSHLVNLSRFLCGEPDKTLSKCIRKDYAQWEWESDQGILVSHMTDVLNERYKKRIEVRGDKGTLVYNFRAHEVFFAPADESERVAIPYKHADHLAESLKYVLEVVEAKGDFTINTLEDACKDMAIIEELAQ